MFLYKPGRLSFFFLFFLILSIFKISYAADAEAATFGTMLGKYRNVPVYSNGSRSFISGSVNSVGNTETGMEWQSTEYVNRYYLLRYKYDLYSMYQGKAKLYYQNAAKMDLSRYRNGGSKAPEVGDILVSAGGGSGHVAIVRSVSTDEVCTVQQNFYNTTKDLNLCLQLKVKNGKYIVSKFAQGFPVAGWLRSIPPYLKVINFRRTVDPIYADSQSSRANPNFAAKFQLKNISNSKSVSVKKLVLTIYDQNGRLVYNMFDFDTKKTRIDKNISLAPSDVHSFSPAYGFFQAPGTYTVVVRAQLSNSVWYDLDEREITVLPGSGSGGGSGGGNGGGGATTVPSSASGLIADATSPTQVTLSWDDNSDDESGFGIQRQNADGTWTTIATVGPNVTGYIDTGLTPDTDYNYRVVAYNDAGSAAPSNMANAHTPTSGGGGGGSPPSAPTNLSAGTVLNQPLAANLTWTDTSDDEDGFRIERRLLSGGPWVEIAVVGPNVESYNDTGLLSNTAYQYRVRAYNDNGNSGYSNTADITTQLIAPSAPSGLTANPVSSNQVDLSWTDNSLLETGFRIQRKTPGGSWATIDTVGANVTSYSDTTAAPGTDYVYRVISYNAIGNSTPSNEASAHTPTSGGGGSGIPSAPINLSAGGILNQPLAVNLSWTDTSDNETGFKIERRLLLLGTWQQIATVGANVTTYDDTGLVGNTAYEYRVRAYNGNGDSDYSNTVNITTQVGL